MPVKSKPQRPPLVRLPWHAEAEKLFELDEFKLVLLVGEPGVGKSSFAQAAALARTGRPPLVLSGSPQTEDHHLFGADTLTAGDSGFADGFLPRALKEDRWWVIEEWSLIPPEVRSGVMQLRDSTTFTNPQNGEVIPVPAGFRLIANSNSETLTCRKNAGVATVTHDGFLVYVVPDLADAQVAEVLRFHRPQAAARVPRVLELWNEYRDFSSKSQTGSTYLSVRAARHLLDLLDAGVPERRAVQIALVNKFITADRDLYDAARTKADMAYADPE